MPINTACPTPATGIFQRTTRINLALWEHRTPTLTVVSAVSFLGPVVHLRSITQHSKTIFRDLRLLPLLWLLMKMMAMVVIMTKTTATTAIATAAAETKTTTVTITRYKRVSRFSASHWLLTRRKVSFNCTKLLKLDSKQQ